MKTLMLLVVLLLVLPGCLKTEIVDLDPWVVEDATKACEPHRGIYQVTKTVFKYYLDCTDGSVFAWRGSDRSWYPRLEK